MHILIYFIAALEWFTTLSIEIIALRKFTPIIGSSSISTSIILGVILLALSYGYYIGGKQSSKKKSYIKKRIVVNLLLASMYYIFITFILDVTLLSAILQATKQYFFSILLATFLLFFIPVFLASQTIPLLAELYKGKHIGETIGKLLFYSTIGSFLWSVLTSSFLFSSLWVYKSGILNAAILCSLASLCAYLFIQKWRLFWTCIAMNIFIILWLFISLPLPENVLFSQANAYHNIKVYQLEWNKKLFSLNGSYSSGISTQSKESFFGYVQESIKKTQFHQPKSVLVIWAAGFSYPYEISQYDFVENIDVIDVDPELKDIAQTYFLETELSDKIHFYPTPARAFIQQTTKKYDMILVDAYSGNSIPPQMLTQEFFDSLSTIGTHIYLNVITDAELSSSFSKNMLTTLISSWDDVYLVHTWYKGNPTTNFLISNTFHSEYQQYDLSEHGTIYIDDKNSIELDIFKQNMLRWKES